MGRVLRPLAHCGCCMLLLLIPALKGTRSEPREPRRWQMHYPPGRTPTAPGHTTTPSAPWTSGVRLPCRPTPLPVTSSTPRPSIRSLLPLLPACSAFLCCFLRQVQTSSLRGGGSDGESVAPPCSLWLLHVAAADSGAEGNEIRAEGAKALAGALAPRQNPDGTWTHNNALSTLYLWGAPSLPAHLPPS